MNDTILVDRMGSQRQFAGAGQAFHVISRVNELFLYSMTYLGMRKMMLKMLGPSQLG